MDLEDIMLSEISQTKTKTVPSHLYVEYLKIKKNRLIETEDRLVAARGEGWGLGEVRKVVRMYRLLASR